MRFPACPPPSEPRLYTRPAAAPARRPWVGPLIALLGLLLTTPALSSPQDSPARALSPNPATTKQPPASGIDRADSRTCMRCHWMPTLAYRDQDTGAIVRLDIDGARYRHATHAKLACLDCHGRGYRAYPHRLTTADESLDCVACHDKRARDGAPDLTAIADEFRASVHGPPDPTGTGPHGRAHGLTCSSCHDPHGFAPLPAGTPLREVIATANDPCLRCHGDVRTGLPDGHAWLPKPEAHWQATRCVDCHAPVVSGEGLRPSHQVVEAAEANASCVECHSRDSRLLNALYVHRAREAQSLHGWWSQALTNEAYIIGMSRNPLLDGISLAVIGLLLAGIAAHATGRWLTRRRRVQ